MMKRTSASGFTLLETLVVTGILLVLFGVGSGVYFSAIERGKMAREIAAGRTLITAYQAYASENNGQFLPGMDYTVSKVWFEPWKRNITMMHTGHRYPFRLAPYFDYQLKGTIFVNDNEAQIRKSMGSMLDYGISLYPAFGINYYLVGGMRNAKGEVTPESECITRQSRASASVLVFASAELGDVDGCNFITAPLDLSYNDWVAEEWREGQDSWKYGYLAPRYDGKAVCVFLDGSIRMLAIEELRDMRLWSLNAALRDDPNYRPQWDTN